MKKMAAVFLVAVLVPTLVLAWLAVRSLRDQELVVNSQRAELHQRASEALAADLNTFMDDVRVFFNQLVDELIQEKGADDLSKNFDVVVKERWSQAGFGCVVTEEGEFLSPSITSSDQDAGKFLKDNRLFLSNQARAVFYQAPAILNSQIMVTENPVRDEQVERDTKADALKKKKTSAELSSISPAKRERRSVDKIASATTALESDADTDTEDKGMISELGRVAATQDQVMSKSAKKPVQRKVEVVEEKLRSVPFRSKRQQGSGFCGGSPAAGTEMVAAGSRKDPQPNWRSQNSAISCRFLRFRQ